MANFPIGRKAVLTAILLLAAAVIAGTPRVADGANDAKVRICHVPPGDPGAAHFITVPAAALAGHLAHGDRESACTPPSTPTACFSFTNTDAEDLPGGGEGAGWFDDCVDDQTTQISVTLRDPDGNVVYQATGPKVGTWTFDQLTSTAHEVLLSEAPLENHDRVITLNNGDLLRISGKNADDSGCAGDLGNGYVIAIYTPPHSGFYSEGIKLLVAPYQRTVDSNFDGPGPRKFEPWSPAAEISWNGGTSDMNSCHELLGTGSPIVGFPGTFEFEVF